MCSQLNRYQYRKWNRQARFKFQYQPFHSLYTNDVEKGMNAFLLPPPTHTIFGLNNQVDCTLQPWIAASLIEQQLYIPNCGESHKKACPTIFLKNSRQVKEKEIEESHNPVYILKRNDQTKKKNFPKNILPYPCTFPKMFSLLPSKSYFNYKNYTLYL